MLFSEALKELTNGHNIAREVWNGKNMYLCWVDNWNGLIHADLTGVNFTFKPFIALLNSKNELVPWNASQDDALSDDWVVLSKDTK